MKKGNNYWKRICTALAKIHIVDKFLLIFMALLLFQSAHNLFANRSTTGDSSHIDVIVRTSTAAIFGYFLSTNFIRHATNGSKGRGVSNVKNDVNNMPMISSGDLQNRIGFTDSDLSNTSIEMGNASFDGNQNLNEFAANKLQIIVTSTIGIFCLVVLIIARDVTVLNADISASASATATATVAQFRDIVSGCIGFLIGCPTTNINQIK